MSQLWHQNTDAEQLLTNLIYGLVQDCSNSIANTLELLQSFTKLSYSAMHGKTIGYRFTYSHWTDWPKEQMQ